MNEKKHNWLLHCLVGVSLVIHIPILMHASGLYRSNVLSYIELALHDMSKPFSRDIPRPRHRPEEPKPEDAKIPKITRQRSPSIRPIKVDPIEKNLPDSLMETIDVPDIPEIPIFDIGNDFDSKELVDLGDFDSEGIYFDMVRHRIERHKKYPERAKIRQIEGFVTVRFVITPQGDVLSVEVTKSSKQKSLDKAAIKAIHAAAPFPKPPKHLFEGEIPLELTIAFELM